MADDLARQGRPSPAELRRLRDACTEKQALWAEAYVETGSMAEAARRAGYGRKSGSSGGEAKNGSPAYLSRCGRRNLDIPAVEAYVDALRRAAAGDPRTRLQQVADRLWVIGSGGSVEQVFRGELRIVPARVSSQIRALEVLAKMLGGLNTKLEVTLGPMLRAQLQALRARMPEEAFVQLLEALEQLSADTGEAGALPADADVVEGRVVE